MWHRQRVVLSLAAFRRRGLVRRLSALLGILGLVQFSLLPVIHSAAAASGPAWLKGAICRAALGITPADNGSAPAPQKPHLCPICLAVSAGGIGMLPAVGGLAPPHVARVPLRSTPTLPRSTTWRGLAALPRAPPPVA